MGMSEKAAELTSRLTAFLLSSSLLLMSARLASVFTSLVPRMPPQALHTHKECVEAVFGMGAETIDYFNLLQARLNDFQGFQSFHRPVGFKL